MNMNLSKWLTISLFLIILATPVFPDEIIKSTYTIIPNVFEDTRKEILTASDKVSKVIVRDVDFNYPVIRKIYSKKIGKYIFAKRIYVPLYSKKGKLIGKCHRGDEVLISTSVWTSDLLFKVWKGTYTVDAAPVHE